MSALMPFAHCSGVATFCSKKYFFSVTFIQQNICSVRLGGLADKTVAARTTDPPFSLDINSIIRNN